MARLPRVYIEGILCYVTSKAGHSQNIFIETSDYKEYISLIDKYKIQYGFKLFSYVLLPSHLHLLIELRNNIGISNIMHDINSLYTKIFNSRYNRKGHLFQERFKATFAEKESYLLPLIRHVLLNPQSLGIVKEPRDYAYSSYAGFIDPAKRLYPNMQDEVEEVFGLLEGREDAFEAYVRDFKQVEADDLRKKLRNKRILGSKSFIARIKKTIEQSAKKEREGRLPKRSLTPYIMIAGFFMLLASLITGYFYKQSTAIKTEYDNTILLYKKTLEMLERERKGVVGAKEEVEEYAWKIRLTEEALKDAEKKRTEAIEAQKEIEGYEWNVELVQVGGPRLDFSGSDTIFFKDNRVSSFNLEREGFMGATYSKRRLKNGNIVWETIQTNEHGETASWRGQWDGKLMRGILTRRYSNGISRDFSFVATGERIGR